MTCQSTIVSKITVLHSSQSSGENDGVGEMLPCCRKVANNQSKQRLIMEYEEIIDITPTPRLLQMLGEIELRPWQCIAEIIDNSFDNFLSYPVANISPEVAILLPSQEERFSILEITDNGTGMDIEALRHALQAGYSRKSNFESLGLFGMGFNISIARLGVKTEVITKVAGEPYQVTATIDLADMQSNNSFEIPLQKSNRASHEHGTTIRIFLKPDVASKMMESTFATTLSATLGRTYSYLLRTQVPGLSGEAAGRDFDFEITINGKRLQPVLPCIWDESRSVEKTGVRVPAVIYVDEELQPRAACNDCGTWQLDMDADKCETCSGGNLERRARRIWGWIGVQRYLDDSEYGIDFLRNGRKILGFDKTIFNYEDLDTGETTLEYPVEVPVNKGRIVGEIHIDHVRCTYQKNNFDRESQDWSRVKKTVRGLARLSDNSNSSPLAKIFRGFRRNNTGVKCLVAGNGAQADTAAAKQMGQKFHYGLPDYSTDALWFKAAEEFDAARNNTTGSGGSTRTHPHDSEDPVGELVGQQESAPAEETETIAPVTAASRFEQILARSRRLPQFSFERELGGYGLWTVVTFVNDESNQDIATLPPIEHDFLAGRSLHIVLRRQHPLFANFGFDLVDALLNYLAVIITSTEGLDRSSYLTVLDRICKELPHLSIAEHQLRDTAQNLIRQIGTILESSLEDQDCLPFWEAITPVTRQSINRIVVDRDPSIEMVELVSSSKFFGFVTADAIADLIQSHPNLFFDGKIFEVRFEQWDDQLKRELTEKWTTKFRQLANFIDGNQTPSPVELRIVKMILDEIMEQIND